MQLAGVFCVVLAFIVSAQALEADEIREKRQTEFILAFPVNSDKETFFEFNGVRLVQLTGETTEMIQLDETDTATCDVDTGMIQSPSLILPGLFVTQCTNITMGAINTITSGVMPIAGPGTLYVGPDLILFIDDENQQFVSLIEANRPNFVPVLPDVEILFPKRGDEIIINLDNTNAGDNSPINTDDGLVLTGANCTRLVSGDSITYTNEVLRVRRGSSTLIGPLMPIVTLDAVLDQNIAGQRCLVLDRDGTSRSGFLPGPGFFCTGESALSRGQEASFFTNSTSTINSIIENVVDCQLSCQVTPDGAMLVGNFTPNEGAELVRLDGAQLLTFENAYTKEQQNGMVVIMDRFDNILQVLDCPDQGGIAFSCFHLNELLVFTGTTGGPLRVPSGGLSVWYNEEDCTAFAYPTELSRITLLSITCLQSSLVTPAPPVSFSFESDGLGGSSLLANGMNILTASSSMSFSVGAGQSVGYSGGQIQIFNSGSSDVVSAFSGVNSFSANTASNSLRSFANSAPNTFSGPGNLFIDNDGRAFFTNNNAVANLIQGSVNNAPQQTVDIVPGMTINGSTQISLQIGGNSFFDIPSDANCMDVEDSEGLAYNDGIVGVAQAEQTSPDTTLVFVDSENLIQVIGPDGEPQMNITDVENLFVRRQIGGTLVFAGSDPFPGGGILYRGSTMDVYLPSEILPDREFEDFITNDIIEDISGGNFIEMCTFFDGTRVQVLNGTSMTLLRGAGFVCIAPDSCFYTDDPELINRLPQEIAQLRPVTVDYNPSTGDISIRRSDGSLIVDFPVNSRIIDTPDGSIFYDGSNITTSSEGNNFLAGGIDTFIYYDGIQTRTIGADFGPLPGGGLLIADEQTGTAFYTTDPVAIDRLINTINGALDTLLPPNIPDTPPNTLISKLNDIEAGFGQVLTVYEGANISLFCDAGNANPPAEITFSINMNFTDPVYVPLMDGDEDVRIVDGANNSTLQVVVTEPGVFEYRCEATNVAGTVFKSTRVNVRPREDVEIDNFFFAGGAGPGEVVVTARTPSAPGDLMIIEVRNVTPILSPGDNITRIDDESQLVNRASIGCKANGRPKPRITWEVAVGMGPREDVGNEFEFEISEPRQGQSVLTVQLEDGDTSCFTFYCIAENGGPAAEGEAIVCPQRFNIESLNSRMMGECSVDCGVGVARSVFQYLRSFNNENSEVSFDDLPAGLVKEDVSFCFAGVCPEITFEYMRGEYGNCSEFCKGGNQTRDVECIRFVDGVFNGTVDDGNCTEFGLGDPDYVRVCNDRPCPSYITSAEGFGMCSQSCRGGVRTRDVSCLMPTFDNETGLYSFDEEGEIIDLEVCQQYSVQVEPASVEECNVDIPCPVRYLPGAFGECDIFNCQERTVSCVNFDPADPLEAWPANRSACEAEGIPPPHSVRDCGGGRCNFGAWVVEELGPCSEVCGIGKQQRTVTCTNVTESDPEEAELEEGYCSSTPRPEESVSCFIQNCPGRCDVEPRFCELIRRARLCKSEALISFTQSCCKSCPFQATPIPPPTTLAPVTVDSTMDPVTAGATTDVVTT